MTDPMHGEKAPDSITKLITTSGNNFHSKVAKWFKSEGWHTVISPYYMDQSQAKAREVDLVVEKIWPVRDRFLGYRGQVLVRLFIECKYVASESVFWFAPKNRRAVVELLCRHGTFKEDNTYTEKHHYLSSGEKVAKLFASDTGRAPENDPFFKALNQVLTANIAMRRHPPSHPQFAGFPAEHISIVLNYPVVVCHSFADMYAVDFLEDSPPCAIKSPFQMEVEYAYMINGSSAINEFFLLDFVEFNGLSNFQSVISEGAQAAAFLAT